MKTRLTDHLMILAIGGLFAIGFAPLSVQAQSLTRVVNALSYPTESQRFFREGVERLEQEIVYLRQQRLQQPVLDIDRLSFVKQYQVEPHGIWQDQPEGDVQYRILESSPSRPLN